MNTQPNKSKDPRSEYQTFTTGCSRVNTGYSLNNELMAERKPIKPEEKPSYGDPSDSSTWAIV